MFALCLQLLPALLLMLATVDYCTADDLPPVKTTFFAGVTYSFINKEKFYIPAGQCYGVLDVYEQPSLRCPADKVIAGILVDVYDYYAVDIMNKLEGDCSNVLIKRKSSYFGCYGQADVFVQVACLGHHGVQRGLKEAVLLPGF